MSCKVRNPVLGLLVAFLLWGCDCPDASPRSFTLELTPATITSNGGTATLTATMNLIYPGNYTLTLEAEQTPAGDAAYELFSGRIIVPEGQTQGSVTITGLSLPAGASQATVVFRVVKVAADPPCSWDANVVSEPLTIVADETPPPPGSGALEVTLLPAGAVAAGARWRVGDGPWQDSGSTLPDLQPATYTVEYATVAGWMAPATESVTVTQGQIVQITRSYTVAGALRVTLDPEEAQGRWSVDGGAWQDSGATVTGLLSGTHSVTYEPKAGWTAPANEEVTISYGRILEITRSYTALPAL